MIARRARLGKPVCLLLIVLMVAAVLVFQPVRPRRAHANPAVASGTRARTALWHR